MNTVLCWLRGREPAGLDQAELCQLRRQIAVVPSKGGLVSNLKFWENITLPLVYHNGEVTAHEEQTGLAYLERPGIYGETHGPARPISHPYDRRVAVLVRAFLQQPRIILYSNCLDGLPPASRTAFAQAVNEFSQRRCRADVTVFQLISRVSHTRGRRQDYQAQRIP